MYLIKIKLMFLTNLHLLCNYGMLRFALWTEYFKPSKRLIDILGSGPHFPQVGIKELNRPKPTRMADDAS